MNNETCIEQRKSAGLSLVNCDNKPKFWSCNQLPYVNKELQLVNNTCKVLDRTCTAVILLDSRLFYRLLVAVVFCFRYSFTDDKFWLFTFSALASWILVCLATFHSIKWRYKVAVYKTKYRPIANHNNSRTRIRRERVHLPLRGKTYGYTDLSFI